MQDDQESLGHPKCPLDPSPLPGGSLHDPGDNQQEQKPRKLAVNTCDEFMVSCWIDPGLEAICLTPPLQRGSQI